MTTYSNILVRATNWIGDAVMSLPALQHLRACQPQARISVLARPWVGSLYAREPFCDEVIPYDASPGWSGLGAKVHLARRLQAYKFDCAVLLQNAFEAAALAWGARIPVRIGYARDARGWLLTQAIGVPKPAEVPRHQRFYYLELLKRAGLIAAYDAEAPVKLSAAGAAANAGRARLKQLVRADTVIAVSPGAAYGGAKRWLPERFAEAAISTAQHLHCAVLVLGSPMELAVCEQVQARIAAAGVESVNLAARTKLDDFIELAAACRLILTNDSGAMHIGYALGVPTVTIFGPTDEQATGPTGSRATIIREPVECSPCLLRECPIDHRCMTRVDSQRVALAAMETVNGR